MITRIASEQLQVGMFVHQLECGWMQHPFLSNQFRISQQADIEKIIRHGIRHVSIDTERGLGLEQAPGPAPATPGSAPAALDLDLDGLEPRPALAQEAPPDPPFPAVPASTLLQELRLAKQVLVQAHAVLDGVARDVRLGQRPQLDQLEPVAEQLIQSVLRNPGALSCLGRVLQKDHYSFEHSLNVCVLMVNFCQHLRLGQRTLRAAAIGALLHDVGKVQLNDTLLNKGEPLSAQERAQLQSHVGLGVDIVAGIPGISDLSLTLVAQHHEHFDGSGYPAALQGAQIAQLAQMMAIVNVYEALTANRPYRAAIEPSLALQRIFSWETAQFNPELVQRFIQCVGIYPVGSLVLLDSGMLAIVTENHPSQLLRPSVRVVLDTRSDLVVSPRDLNLAKPGVRERIVSSESAARWKIDLGRYLQ